MTIAQDAVKIGAFQPEVRNRPALNPALNGLYFLNLKVGGCIQIREREALCGIRAKCRIVSELIRGTQGVAHVVAHQTGSIKADAGKDSQLVNGVGAVTVQCPAVPVPVLANRRGAGQILDAGVCMDKFSSGYQLMFAISPGYTGICIAGCITEVPVVVINDTVQVDVMPFGVFVPSGDKAVDIQTKIGTERLV